MATSGTSLKGSKVARDVKQSGSKRRCTREKPMSSRNDSFHGICQPAPDCIYGKLGHGNDEIDRRHGHDDAEHKCQYTKGGSKHDHAKQVENNPWKCELDDLFDELFKPDVTPSRMAELYDRWSETYEKHMADHHPTLAVTEALEISRILGENKIVKILDVGAGTGYLGNELKKLGFTNIDALDGSKGMLKKAKEKKIYKNYICELLGMNQLSIKHGSYDVAVTMGAFVPGHLKPNCIPELIRIVKPGGYIMILTNDFHLKGSKSYRKELEKHMKNLHDENTWNWMSTKRFGTDKGQHDGICYSFMLPDEEPKRKIPKKKQSQ